MLYLAIKALLSGMIIAAVSEIAKRWPGFGALVGPTIQQLTQAVRVAHGKAQFEPFAINAMPANDLYEQALR